MRDSELRKALGFDGRGELCGMQYVADKIRALVKEEIRKSSREIMNAYFEDKLSEVKEGR